MARTAARKQQAETDVLSLKVTLRNISPPIWRRIIVPRHMTLDDLHSVIQAFFGWENEHLYGFEFGRRRSLETAMLDAMAEEGNLTLDGLVESGRTSFTYIYDFGDSWRHDILIEKKLPATTAKAFPACVAGERSGPPEDCGGAWGYAELLAAVADPDHPEHEERLEWLGKKFDPEAFRSQKPTPSSPDSGGGRRRRPRTEPLYRPLKAGITASAAHWN